MITGHYELTMLKNMSSGGTEFSDDSSVEIAPHYNGPGDHLWIYFSIGPVWGVGRCRQVSYQFGDTHAFVWRGFHNEQTMLFDNPHVSRPEHTVDSAIISSGKIKLTIRGSVCGRGITFTGSIRNEPYTPEFVYWLDHPKYWTRLFCGISEKEQARQAGLVVTKGKKAKGIRYAVKPNPIWAPPTHDDPKRIYEDRVPPFDY